MKKYAYILAILITCSTSYAGTIAPGASGGGAISVGPKGKTFSYVPAFITGKNGQITPEEPAKAHDWSLSGTPFSGSANAGGQSYTVKTDVTKLDPESIINNQGTLTCKEASTNIQGSSVD